MRSSPPIRRDIEVVDARHRPPVPRDLRRLGRDGGALRTPHRRLRARRRCAGSARLRAGHQRLPPLGRRRGRPAARVRKVEPLAPGARRRRGVDHRACAPSSRRDRAATPFAAFDRGLRSGQDQSARRLEPRSDVERYVADHRVPYNALHDRGFPSIGCAPCTRAVRVGEPERAGRWWWEDGQPRRNAACTSGRRSPTTPTALSSLRRSRELGAAQDRRHHSIRRRCADRLTHLQRLEAESIHILREVAAECEKPVMLYSIGKDSSVLLHLAHEGVLSRHACRSRCCTSTRPGSSAR